jgi:hypothetical protein
MELCQVLKVYICIVFNRLRVFLGGRGLDRVLRPRYLHGA